MAASIKPGAGSDIWIPALVNELTINEGGRDWEAPGAGAECVCMRVCVWGGGGGGRGRINGYSLHKKMSENPFLQIKLHVHFTAGYLLHFDCNVICFEYLKNLLVLIVLFVRY